VTRPHGLGPPPFRFAPLHGFVEGPAFSMPFKGVATILTLTAAGWFFKLWLEGKAAGGTVSILAWFVAALAMMA